MRYFLWISTKDDDPYCAVYRQNEQDSLQRWEEEENDWVATEFADVGELAWNASGLEEDILLEAK